VPRVPCLELEHKRVASPKATEQGGFYVRVVLLDSSVIWTYPGTNAHGGSSRVLDDPTHSQSIGHLLALKSHGGEKSLLAVL
jgi:hypothetical protein